jgi:hypothetical protein
MSATQTIIGLTVCCLWSVAWGWRYHSQMKQCKRRAEWAEYQLKKGQENDRSQEN